MIVAIDGPAGAGKSTVARAVADALGVGYVDTGAMYRALTLLGLRSGVDLADDAVLADLARANPVRLDHGSSGLRVYIAGDDVTMAIREADVTGAVSQVAAHPGVRAEMVERQRDIMAIGVWVADGRDIRDDVERRDHADSSRAASPLVVADGAVILDTTGMGIDEVVRRIAGMAQEARS